MSDRKYSHRGYQDDKDKFEPASRQNRPPRDDDRPRGRSVGLSAKASFQCFRCGKDVRGLDDFGTDSTCTSCDADLYTCTNCNHYDTGSRFECRVESAVRVMKKSTRNECPDFTPRVKIDLGGQRNSPPRKSDNDNARAAFDALFKK